jgi:hypothetical protein
VFKSSEEHIAIIVHAGFPQSELIQDVINDSSTFSIVFDGKVLLELDHVGVRFFIPVRGKNTASWRSFLEGGPDDVANKFLQDLADAGFNTLRADGAKMLKRRIRISKQNFCPECDEQGGLMEIRYGVPNPEKFDYGRDIAGDRRMTVDGPNVKCTLCGWTGEKETLRFFKRERTLPAE